MRRRRDVALVGRRLPDNENLGIAYLVSALETAGLTVQRLVLNELNEVETLVAELMRDHPPVVGLSIPDGGSAFYPLALGELLRRRGYGGHITCGGGFATLAKDWLLERYHWLDSVVRHAGEVPIVELTCRVKAGSSISDVPGLSTRDGDGGPAPVLDDHWRNLWPSRSELPNILGRKAAHLSLSRGCRGRCAYCGPAALQRSERKEGLRCGASLRELKSAGVGSVKWRELDDLCDEMASLWHNRDVRYFYLVDEHPLPWQEEEALEFLQRWRRGLDERQVGPMGIGCMLRSDKITPAVAEAFVDVGLVRCFVGLELATAEESRLFARGPMYRSAPALIRTLEQLGVATVSNLMLVHPYSTQESIEAGIGLLADLPGGLFETIQMQVYHGTRLHQQLSAEGRLVGNPLRYGYQIEDPVVARFSEIFTRLRAEAFRDYSVAYAVHDVWLQLGLARCLNPDREYARERRRVRSLAREVNALRTGALAVAFESARKGDGWSESDALVRQARLEVDALSERLSVLLDELESERLPSRPWGFTPLRSAAVAAVHIVALSTPLAGCYNHRSNSTDDAGADTSPPPDGDVGIDGSTCIDETVEETLARAQDLFEEVDGCFPGVVSYERERWNASPHLPGMISGNLSTCHDDDLLDVMQERAQQLEEQMQDRFVPPCELDERVQLTGAEPFTEAEAVEDALQTCDTPRFPERTSGIMIRVDDDGRVVEVTHENPSRPVAAEVLECVRAALDGLNFPCLANLSICPEFIIVE